MSPPTPTAGALRLRNLTFFRDPQLWPQWPFLPVMRRRPGVEEEYGVLYDACGSSGKFGYACTIFLANYFLLPSTEEEFLALPRETYDTPEEVADAGWTVD
jgi:hypothetical protein